MTAYITTPEQHAQAVDTLDTIEALFTSMDIQHLLAYREVEAALAMLKAMKPAKPKGWVTQAGTVTGAIAGDGSAHDGELYGWKPLYAKEKQ